MDHHIRNFIKQPRAILGAAMLLAISAVTMGPTAARAAAHQVPFGEAVAGTISFTPCGQTFTCGPDEDFAMLQYQGNAIHLGNVHGSATLRVLGPQGCGYQATIVDETMTAANGDQIFIRVDMTMCPTAVQGTYEGNGSYSIEGGTGRFLGATGSGVFMGVGDFVNAMITCNFSGTITIQ
jgi:hypothetical protein